MTHEERITTDLADALCRRIARQTRLALAKMTDCRLSGDDTPLKNVWEEICVQRQDEESFAWSAYEQTISAIIGGFVGKLERFELEAIWLQTDQATDFLDRQESNGIVTDGRPSVCESSIVEHVLNKYVLAEAVNWSNTRIRNYLDSRSE